MKLEDDQISRLSYY